MRKIPEYVKSVQTHLLNAGYTPYLVGGCVRDLLRGAEPTDYDMTSDALPEEIISLFGEASRPTGLRHGTVTVISEGHPIEITTMRRDGAYRDNRHPEAVAFTKNIEEDLARRDFTVNAIALSADGEIVDPFGGQTDLEEKLLRCVGDAETRFKEDALRMLRLLRFAAVLGFSVDTDTAAAARECRGLMQTVAHERVYTELNKLLCGEYAQQVLLAYPGILGAVLPEILPCVGFDQKNHHHCFDVWEHTCRAVGAVPPKRELRWTMLFHDLGKPDCFTVGDDGEGHYYGHTAISAEIAEGIMERLHFEKSLREQVRAQLRCFDDLFPPERAAIHKEMAKYGRAVVGNLLLTKRADNAAKAPDGLARAQAPWLAAQSIYDTLLAEGACCAVQELAVSGEHMISLGFSGKSVGAVLDKLLEEVAAEKLPNTYDDLIQRAQRLYRSGYGRQKTE